jgi:hypothetical protein
MRYALVFLLSATVTGHGLAAATPVIDKEGRIWQGPCVMFMDNEGGLCLQDGGLPIFAGAGVKCGYRGYTTFGAFEDRKVERGPGAVTMSGRLPGTQTSFTVKAIPDGNRVRVTIRRQGPWPAGTEWASFQMEVPMARVAGASFLADARKLPYPAKFDGKGDLANGFHLFRLCPARTRWDFTVESETGMGLQDFRKFGDYQVSLSAGLPREGDSSEITLLFTLPRDPKGPLAAVRYCPQGYPGGGKKRVVLEWPSSTPRPGDGVSIERKGGSRVASGRFGPAAEFMGFSFASFDFSGITKEGEYRAVWSGGKTPWFRVKKGVFGTLWQATVDEWLPWQMCHAQVKAPGKSAAHRACHMDDGKRVPANSPDLDGFVSYDCEGTPFKEGDHIPCATGGWHDAGDNDLNVTAQGFSTHRLALAWEEFGMNRDKGTLDGEKGAWKPGQPDGVPDVLNQVEWGARWLLSMLQDDGRVYLGVIAKRGIYGANKAPEDVTDGKPGNDDDRNVYVDYHSDIQLKFVTAMYACSRVLAGPRPELAAKCRDAGGLAWVYFKKNGVRERASSYSGPPPKGGMGPTHMLASALAEAWLTTGATAYLSELEVMSPAIMALTVDYPSPRRSGCGNHWYAPPFLARILPRLKDGPLKDACLVACRNSAGWYANQLKAEPWPFSRWDLYKWGNSGAALNSVHDAYWLAKAGMPGVTMADALSCGLWMEGLHPLNDYSMVCGQGRAFPRHLYNSRVHGRSGHKPGWVNGAVVPGIGGDAEAQVLGYADDYGFYVYNEACIYTAAEYVFACAALDKAGY